MNMIIGRREDYIEKLKRDCAAWKRQDAQLSITAGSRSIFYIAMDVVAAREEHTDIRDIEGYPVGSDQRIDWYSDAVLVDVSERVGRREGWLRLEILKYFEENDSRAKAAARQQLTMEF